MALLASALFFFPALFCADARLSGAREEAAFHAFSKNLGGGVFSLRMGPTAVRKRRPGTRFEERIQRQKFALRTALRERNRCLYTPLPVEEARRLCEFPTQEEQRQRLVEEFSRGFPKCLDEVRVPRDKQPRRGWEEREGIAKMVWRRVQDHVESLPQQVEEMQKLAPSPTHKLNTHNEALSAAMRDRDAVW